MSTKEQRHQIFKDCFEKLSIKQADLARWMYLGEINTNARKNVSGKLSDRGPETRPVSTMECALIQVLCMLDEQGYDLTAVEFDDEGKMIKLPLI